MRHSLEAPLNWLVPRLEAGHLIEVHEKVEGKISSLLELAKLDSNVIQALHQKEIKDTSRKQALYYFLKWSCVEIPFIYVHFYMLIDGGKNWVP